MFILKNKPLVLISIKSHHLIDEGFKNMKKIFFYIFFSFNFCGLLNAAQVASERCPISPDSLHEALVSGEAETDSFEMRAARRILNHIQAELIKPGENPDTAQRAFQRLLDGEELNSQFSPGGHARLYDVLEAYVQALSVKTLDGTRFSYFDDESVAVIVAGIGNFAEARREYSASNTLQVCTLKTLQVLEKCHAKMAEQGVKENDRDVEAVVSAVLSGAGAGDDGVSHSEDT